MRNGEARANPGPDATTPIVPRRPELRKGERACSTCGRIGHTTTTGDGLRLYGDVAPIIVDRARTGDPIPIVQLVWRDGSDRPFTISVPERYVPAWGCRDRAACRAAAVDPRTELLS